LSNIDKDAIGQLKKIKDRVNDGLNDLHHNNKAPKEFLEGIKIEMQEFISDPKWEKILGMIPSESLSDQYNSLTTHITSYNNAFDDDNEQKIEHESIEIKKFAQRIILNLNSNIEIMEKGEQVVEEE
jgi:hypothetical protein